jgi:hypothetical protein
MKFLIGWISAKYHEWYWGHKTTVLVYKGENDELISYGKSVYKIRVCLQCDSEFWVKYKRELIPHGDE